MTGDSGLGLSGLGLQRPTGGAPVRAPQLTAHDSGGGGRSATALADLRTAGLHPAEAFGAAAAMHKIIGHDPIHQRLTNLAAGPQDVPEAKKSEGGKGKGGKGNKGGKGAAKQAQSDLAKAFAKRDAGEVGKQIGGIAAKRGGMLGAKMALRAGAMTLPGLGTAVMAACWLLDSSERSAVNNLIARTLGGGSPAPGLDEAPEPPRTYFLPVTHDGNRDPSIVRMDQGMVRTNTAAFRFHPDDVWPSAPRIETTSDFRAVAAKVNGLAAKVGGLAESIQSVYTAAAAEEPHLQRMWSQVKPGVTALDGLKDTVLPAIGHQLMDGAEHANAAYQAFRDINTANRREIHNSTSGLIPFMANHVDEHKMSDSTEALRTATAAMDRTAQALTVAADPFTIADRAGVPGPTSGSTSPQPASPAAPAPSVVDVSKTSPIDAPTPGPADAAKDLASLLKSGMPTMPMMPSGMGMPTMPSMPGLGSGIPGLANAMPRPADATLARNTDPLKKALDDQLKDRAEKADEKAAKKPGDAVGTPVIGSGPAAAQPAVNKVGPALGEPGTPGGRPGAANTTEIGGKKWTFDNPKSAALAHNMSGTDGSSNKSLRQAAAEAGFRLPPPGQDIGTPVPGADIKPGDVIMGANNQNACYLGEQDGRAMAITERGELKPLDEVMKITGPHEGIFRLDDDGAPVPEEQVIQKTAGQAEPPAAAPQPPATPPPAPPATDPGIIPTPPRSGQPGMDPSSTPAGN